MKKQTDTLDILHHVGVINANLDQLAACYEKLGFTLTPVSMPRIPLTAGGKPELLGAGNRCAMFRKNYLELLGVIDADRWKQITRVQRGPFDIEVPLHRYAGLHVMHFGTDHIEQVRERLKAQGTPCSDIRLFQRDVQTPDGEQTMRARSMHFPPGSDPEALIQIAQHDTPELIFQPRYMDHANGATGITGIMICVQQAAEYAAKYERYTGHTFTRMDDNYYTADLGHSKMVVLGPTYMTDILPDYKVPDLPFLPAFMVETKDLNKTREVLTGNNVLFLEQDHSITVHPEYAGGSAVIFHQQKEPAIW